MAMVEEQLRCFITQQGGLWVWIIRRRDNGAEIGRGKAANYNLAMAAMGKRRRRFYEPNQAPGMRVETREPELQKR